MFHNINIKRQVQGNPTNQSMFIVLAAIDEEDESPNPPKRVWPITASGILDGYPTYQIKRALLNVLEHDNKLIFNNLVDALKAGNELVANVKDGSDKNAFQILEVKSQHTKKIKENISSFLTEKKYEELSKKSYRLYDRHGVLVERNDRRILLNGLR